MRFLAAIAADGYQATIADRLGGWAQGCLVLLIGVWLFLALLGIRNSRFPWRILGGFAFIAGSALWLGLHPGRAAAWELDSGYLGFAAQQSLMEPFAHSPFLVNIIGALLAACSVLGLLVAIDWLPLLPFAPLLAGFEGRLARVAADRAAARAAQAAEARQRANAAAAQVLQSTSATLERPASNAAAVPAAARPSSPPITVAESAAVVAAAIAATRTEERVETSVAPTATDAPAAESLSTRAAPAEDAPVAAAEVTFTGEVAAADEAAPSASKWERFRPRARSIEPPAAPPAVASEIAPEIPAESADVLPVDNEGEATHNSSLAEGASRSEELPTSAAPADVRPGAASEETEPTLEAPVRPDPEQKDPPVLDHERDEETLAADSSAAGVAVLDGEPAGVKDAAPAAPEAPPEAPVDETLAPRRKKEDDEPAEEPGEEPSEEPGEEEEGEDDFEEGEEEEEWEEEDEEEEKEEGTEEEEEWDDEEDEEDEDEEEDDEFEDDDEEEEEDEEKEDDEDEDDEKWDDDQSSSHQPAPQAQSPLDVATPPSSAPAAVEPLLESAAEPISAVSSALTSPTPVEVSDAPPSAELPAAPSAEPSAAPSLPAHLFRDLPEDERDMHHRAVLLLLGIESVSLSKLQRELAITYYSAARVFERLEKEGFIAPYSGSLARTVKLTRSEWEKRLQG